MAAISQVTRLFNKARVFSGPSTLTGGAPYGGTELGAIQGVRPTTNAQGRVFVDYVDGAAIDAATVYPSGPPKIQLLFRQWDPDAIALLFPSTAGTGTVIQAGAGEQGQGGRARAVKLLLAAEDTTGGVFCLIQLAIPVEDGSEFEFSLERELVFAATFLAAKPDSGSTSPFQIGTAANMTI